MMRAAAATLLACSSTLAAAPQDAVNDAFFERANEAEELLLDESGSPADQLDRWSKALTIGDGLVADTDVSSESVTIYIDVQSAIRRRLTDSTSAQRAAWETRTQGLEPARRPGTVAAFSAALAGFDRASERGALEAAGAWLQQLEVELSCLVGEQSERRSMLLARRTFLAQFGAPFAGQFTPEASAATRLEFQSSVRLDDPEARLLAERHVSPGSALRPGLARMSATEVVVQSESLLTRFLRDAQGVWKLHERVDLLGLVDGGFVNTALAFAVPGAPGWGLAPAARDGVVFCVQGRVRNPEEPNALVAVRLDSAARWRPGASRSNSKTSTAKLAWGWAGDRRLVNAQTGELAEEPRLAELRTAEFQPDPVLVDDLVIVQARVDSGAVEAWLVAFRASDGAFVWKRRLARGSDRSASSSRFGQAAHLAAGRLSVHDGLVFAPTHLGTGSLVRASDGKILWTAAYRRRALNANGQSGGRAVEVRDGDARALVWAPADADLRLRLGLSAPAALSEAPALEDPTLIGASWYGAWVLGRAGNHETVRWQGPKGRVDAIHLDPKERFRGVPALVGERLIAATDRGLYLFDLTRELYLFDFEPFPSKVLHVRASTVQGGDVFVIGQEILVLGRDALSTWNLR